MIEREADQAEYIEWYVKGCEKWIDAFGVDVFKSTKHTELLTCCVLGKGYCVYKVTHGWDGWNPQKQKIELKSTRGKTITATYNGISVFPTIEGQKDEFQRKIFECIEHYFMRLDGPRPVEMYFMSSSKVFEILWPKVEKQWQDLKAGASKKDPRIGVIMTEKEIKTFGKMIDINVT
jgi:hypothetical protein